VSRKRKGQRKKRARAKKQTAAQPREAPPAPEETPEPAEEEAPEPAEEEAPQPAEEAPEPAEEAPSEDKPQAKLSAAPTRLDAEELPSKPESKQSPSPSPSSSSSSSEYGRPDEPDEGKLGRRAFDRVPVKTTIGLATQSNLYTGLTNDISEGGVFVATHQLLPIGTEIDLQLSFADVDGPELDTRAIVRWIRDESAGEGQPGMGVCFLDLDAAQREWIQGFVESRRQPLFFEPELKAKNTRSEQEQAQADLIDVRGSRLKGALVFAAALLALALVAAYLFGAL
jgi:uncharacterized protein (TIGR02266 family)